MDHRFESHASRNSTKVFLVEEYTNETHLDFVPGRKPGLLSDFTRYMFDILVWTLLSGCVSVFGMTANVINLIVFVRQGIWTESVTASLAGLAVADLCCTTTQLVHSINFVFMAAQPPGIPWDPLSILYVASGWPRIMFTRLTCWITAYVAFERCMCIVLPFKVKQLFTARRTVFVISCVFVVIIASYIPIYYTHRLLYLFDSTTNTSKVTLVLTDNAEDVEYVTRHLNDIILPTISLSIVIICTQLTIVRLKASKKWKRKNASSGYVSHENDNGLHTNASNPAKTGPQTAGTGTSGASAKETKVVKMITLICTIFIICNSPCVIIFYTRLLIPEIGNLRRYHNLFHVIYSLDFLMETINSSINIIVYYKMSTRYKQEFRLLFGLTDNKT